MWSPTNAPFPLIGIMFVKIYSDQLLKGNYGAVKKKKLNIIRSNSVGATESVYSRDLLIKTK